MSVLKYKKGRIRKEENQELGCLDISLNLIDSIKMAAITSSVKTSWWLSSAFFSTLATCVSASSGSLEKTYEVLSLFPCLLSVFFIIFTYCYYCFVCVDAFACLKIIGFAKRICPCEYQLNTLHTKDYKRTDNQPYNKDKRQQTNNIIAKNSLRRVLF